MCRRLHAQAQQGYMHAFECPHAATEMSLDPHTGAPASYHHTLFHAPVGQSEDSHFNHQAQICLALMGCREQGRLALGPLLVVSIWFGSVPL